MKLIETYRKNPLVLLAALVQAGAFALAGSVYFGPFGWALGGLAGIVVNLSLALAASRISDIAMKRKPLAYTSLIALMLLSPLAVAPAEYMLLTSHAPMLGGWMLALAVVWSTLPDWAILAAGGVIGKSLMVAGSDAVNVAQRPSMTLKVVGSDAQRRSRSLAAKIYRCECGFETDNRNRYSGHQGHCAHHKQAAAGPLIPIELPSWKEQP